MNRLGHTFAAALLLGSISGCCTPAGVIPAPITPGGSPAMKNAPAAARGEAPGQRSEAAYRGLIDLARIEDSTGNPDGKRVFRGAQDLAARRAEARAAGIPTTPEELDKWLPAPAKNAAADYARLTRLLRERPFTKGETDLVYMKRPLPSDFEIRARRLLSTRADLLKLILAATDRPGCRFERRWTDGAALSFPEQATIRKAAGLVHVKSYLLAKEGKYAEAVALQSRGFALAHHAAADPTMIACYTAASVNTIALAGLRDIMLAADGDARTLGSIRQAIADGAYRPDVGRALAGECGYMDATWSQLRSGGPRVLAGLSGAAPGPPMAPMSAEERRVWKLIVDAAEAEYLEADLGAIRSLRDPYPARQAALTRIDDKTGTFALSLTLGFRAVLFPDYHSFAQMATREDALSACTGAGAAVLEWRAVHQRLPDVLEQAVPKPPEDPFTGKPLLYRREGDTFIVYSAGPDGSFDGHPSAKPDRGREIFFRYPEPGSPLNPPH